MTLQGAHHPPAARRSSFLPMFGTIAFVLIVLLAVLTSTLVPPGFRPLVWMGVVVVGVVPWSSWVGHAHWERLEWLPFSGAIRVRDIVLNVLLYVPFGWFVAGIRPDGGGRWGWREGLACRGPLVTAVLLGLALSLATEATQIFSHRRFPSATDVVTNTTGALVGAWLATRFPRRAAS